LSTPERYYEAAASWADDRVEAAARQQRIAWIVAAIAGSTALILAVALVILLPLKTVAPYVLTVDRQSGAVQAATTLAGSQLRESEAVIQAQLAQYVRARESFDETDLAHQYRRVQLLSSGPVAQAYVAQMAAANPASPLRTLAKGDTVSVEIQSVSLLASGVGLVRFETQRRAPGAAEGMRGVHVAAISFGFADRALRMEDRFDNPLGFQVTRYRRDTELEPTPGPIPASVSDAPDGAAAP
jgi:type IV secretion system protein VirB8